MLTPVVLEINLSLSPTPIDMQIYIVTMTLTTQSRMYPLPVALLLMIIQMSQHIYLFFINHCIMKKNTTYPDQSKSGTVPLAQFL